MRLLWPKCSNMRNKRLSSLVQQKKKLSKVGKNILQAVICSWPNKWYLSSPFTSYRFQYLGQYKVLEVQMQVQRYKCNLMPLHLASFLSWPLDSILLVPHTASVKRERKRKEWWPKADLFFKERIKTKLKIYLPLKPGTKELCIKD